MLSKNLPRFIRPQLSEYCTILNIDCSLECTGCREGVAGKVLLAHQCAFCEILPVVLAHNPHGATDTMLRRKELNLTRPLFPSGQNRASAQIIGLVVLCLVLGAGITALWYHNAGKSGSRDSRGGEAKALSGGSRAVLARISSPVEIRYYALLDPASISEPEKAFASRVDLLLTTFEQEGAGKVKLVRVTERSDKSATDAFKDGIKAFNLDKGDACYLGVAVAGGTRTESLPRLDAEWEPALESDIARAISKVSEARPPADPASTLAAKPIDSATKDEIKKVVPNLDTVSLEEGTRLLRQAAVDEFAAAAKEMEQQIKEAQAQMKQSQSPSEQETAMKLLRDLQLQQADRLKEIAAKSQVQIQALRQIKESSR